MSRIKELDYLRGIAASAIMLYHYFKWLYIYEGANSILGRMSVYGVEIFYILSGTTLYCVYHETICFDKKSLLNYFSKRCFRIFPLFWLSIFIALVIGLKQTNFSILFLNVSGLFSLLAWEKYIAPGTWSIGNELVFYLIFPFFLMIYRKKKIMYFILLFCTLLIFNHFAFHVFNPNDTLHNQWKNFVNPLNHLFLFLVGMTIPIVVKSKTTSPIVPSILICIGVIILFTSPSENDGIHLLYGINRWIFSIASILICIGFYTLDLNMPEKINKPFQRLGEISYSIYLLHPFVYQIICSLIRKLILLGVSIPPSNYLLICISVFLTLVISNFVYQNYEVFFIKTGKKWYSNFYKS
ncbi:MAG TPA: acyltransferase [Bacteroidia bacterium]|nr:acyltransferase [Bacteroidia bacterium]